MAFGIAETAAGVTAAAATVRESPRGSLICILPLDSAGKHRLLWAAFLAHKALTPSTPKSVGVYELVRVL